MYSLLRIVKFAFQDIVRNISLSFMTVLILVLMLLSVNSLFIVNVLTTKATEIVKNQIDVSIYFDHEATEKSISEIREYVNTFPEVINITYYTRDEVLEQFKQEHRDNPEILESLQELESNPLGATMIVKMRQPGDYEKVIKALNVPEYENIIEAKTFGDTQKAIDRINTITVQVERFSIALSLFFGVIAFLIIFNTIRVAIFTQRTEISIKKLVGATNWFVRGPYMVNAIVFSLLSVAIAYSLIILITGLLDPYISIVLQINPFLTEYFKTNIIMLAGIQFGAVLALTIISSMLAMRKHLRA